MEVLQRSLKVSLAGFPCAINKIGVLFTNVFYGDTTVIPAPVMNNFAHVYTSVIITNTTSWTAISGSFVSNSAYQYILVGNFFDDANTDTTILSGSVCASYYFIDDICVSTDSFTCVDITNEVIDFNADTTAILVDSCINFSVNTVVDYDFYEWQFPGGIPNISTDSMPQNICYESLGTYSVTLIVSDSSGCSDTIIKTNYITVQQSTGILNTEVSNNQIKIYPNPIKDFLFVEFENDKMINIKIYNIFGILVYINKDFANINNKIDLSVLPSGIYLLKFQTNNEVITKKIILDKF